MAEDLYSLLGVARGADADAIKKAYRKLAKELHPDRNPGNNATEARFKKVNHAFDVLGDPKKRKLYDEFGEDGLREGFDPDRVRQYRDWSARDRSGGFDGGAVNVDEIFGRDGGAGGAGGFSDVFSDLFGRSRRGRGPMKGQDVESEITIDFTSALRGATLELRPQTQGGIAGDVVTVRIPAGADEGSRVRIAGHGGLSPNGGPRGDLLLHIHVQPHEHFRRDGDDLHVDVPITITEAFRGAKVKVPTIDGAVSLKVPERSQSGSVVRVRGKGVARKGKEPGSLYVHFLAHVPTESTPEIEKAIDLLATAEGERGEELRKALKL